MIYEEATNKKKFSSYLKTWLIFFVAVFVIRSLAFEAYAVPSASMMPTLQAGDMMVTSKMSYGYSRYSFPFSPSFISGRFFASAPQRGDVAVFRFTKDTSISYVKRIIGLPGDHVQMVQGRLLLNGKPVLEESKSHYLFKETLPRNNETALFHDILKHTDAGFANNTPEYVVPAGSLFVMGDNRDNSSDSRFQGPHDLGFVPMDNLVAKVQVVLFSFNWTHPVWEVWYWPSELRVFRTLHMIG